MADIVDEFGVLSPELKHIDEHTIEFGETGVRMYGKGYYFFIQGNDLGWLARVIQKFIDMGYEPHGEPFFLEGKFCQAMIDRNGLHKFWQEVHSARDAAARAAKEAQVNQSQPAEVSGNHMSKLPRWILEILARR